MPNLLSGIFIVLIFLFCLVPQSLYSQPYAGGYSYNLKYHRSFVMQHSINMAHLANQRPFTLELDATKQTYGQKEWERVYKYPKMGFAFYFFRMDPDKPLGNSYALLFHIGKTILKSKRSSLGIRLGLGPGFVERRFDLKNNYKNNLISSRVNFSFNGSVHYNYKITSTFSIQAGIGLVHLSNGAVKVPNLGINLPSAHIGIGFQPVGYAYNRDSLSSYLKTTNFYISYGSGIKQVYPVNGPGYYAGSFSAYVGRRINRKSVLLLGTDIFYDGSSRKYFQLDPKKLFPKDPVVENKNRNFFKSGITIGHELLLGKMAILTQMGVYIYDPVGVNSAVYQRIKTKYYINKDLFAGIALKTHFGSADYVEWSFGIKI